MQILENWDPLNLPRGSVRALVVLALLGVLWGLMVAGRDVSPLYASVVFIALGHYFAARTRRRGEEKERPPLGLPRGTIRFLITIGFGIVAWLLWSDGRLVFSGENRYAAIIVLAFALILGQVLGGLLRIVTRGRATRPHRWVANFQAIVVIIAVGVLGVAAVLGNEHPANDNLALIAAPIVTYYFGARD